GRVRRGESFSTFRARDWNGTLDAARDLRSRKHNLSRTPAPPAERAGSIFIRNTTDFDLLKFSVLTLGEPVFGPDANLEGLKDQPYFDGQHPAVGDVNVAITQEPLAPGASGRALVAGATLVQLEVEDDSKDYPFAYPVDVAGGLVAGGAGVARILWRERN